MNSNLLDSNLHKIHNNMLVLPHNRFRNSSSITNNNFVLCSLIKALSKHYAETKCKETLCTSLARVHEHKDTFDKLSNLYEIYAILVSL